MSKIEYTSQFVSVIREPMLMPKKIGEKKLKSPRPTPHPLAMDRVKDNLKNEDDVRKEDSLEMKTHTAPPLRPSVVLVLSKSGWSLILAVH